jgi:hypothetical protein
LSKIEGSPTPVKKIGIRSLKTVGDCRTLQARLLRSYLAGDIDESTFKTACYGLNSLLNCFKTEYLVNPNEAAGLAPITTVELVIGEKSDFLKKIEAMNADIMDAPE